MPLKFELKKEIDEKCKQFKKEALDFMKKNKTDELVINIAEVANYFNYNLEKQFYNWLPKSIRDRLLKIGVHTKKVRGQMKISVTVD